MMSNKCFEPSIILHVCTYLFVFLLFTNNIIKYRTYLNISIEIYLYTNRMFCKSQTLYFTKKNIRKFLTSKYLSHFYSRLIFTNTIVVYIEKKITKYPV